MTQLVFQLLLRAALFFSPPAFAFTVMIDPGHGGVDVGATRDGFHEADLTLQVSKLLFERLSETEDITPLLTRDSDINLELEERVQMAHRNQANVFLSIHANASPDRRARGVEFYFQNQLEASEAATFLAHQENQLNAAHRQARSHEALHPHWSGSLKTIFLDLLDQARVKQSFLLSKALRENWQGTKKSKAHSLKQAPFHVVSRTNIPSSLVELGFLTNSTDFRKLQEKEYLETIVASLVQGVKDFKKQQEQP